MENKNVELLGIEVSNMDFNKTVSTIVKAADREEKQFIVTANPEIIMHGYGNEEYRSVLMQADIITADGIGVVKAAKILGNSIPERVAGFDLFLHLLKKANEKGSSIYLLGAEEKVLKKTVKRIEYDFSNIKIVGKHNGFFDRQNEKEIIGEIKETRPDFVFVALGFPRQEQWIASNIKQFQKGIFMGIGGSFDVLAGEVKRAPKIWRQMNLEWLYRLIKQPSRWKRMLVLPRFVIKILKQKISNGSRN